MLAPLNGLDSIMAALQNVIAKTKQVQDKGFGFLYGIRDTASSVNTRKKKL
jgi:hypothetical protein